jgi:cysteine desulfurase/selenocysteine lyase
MLDPNTLRNDFPIFESDPRLVYLDSAATALKPKAIIEAMNRYYFEYSTNVGRGLYPLAEKATLALSEARRTVAQFVNAENEASVVFTANATHGINLVALGLEHAIDAKRNIIVTELEHHSNYLPWKELASRTGAELRTARFTTDGKIDQEHLLSLVDRETAVVAFSAVSNVFGSINPVKEIIAAIRIKNPQVLVLIDACQAAGHIRIDIQDWDADYLVFSGHKLFGPTGIGVLAGKKPSLELLYPMNVGGGTVLDACSPKPEYKALPENLEGGTPNIAGAIGLAAAVEYVARIGIENIRAHETALTRYALEELAAAFGQAIRILGTSDAIKRVGIVSFALDGIHPHDIAQVLGEENICVRAGEHCAAPLHRSLSLSATTRLSLSLYNTIDDIDRCIAALSGIRKRFTA